MRGEHPTRKVLDLFLRGELPDGDRRQVLAHLLDGCSSCYETSNALWSARKQESRSSVAGPSPSAEDFDYDSVFDRVFDQIGQLDSAIEREREEAPELMAQLIRHPLEHQLLLVRNGTRFATWGLAERLIDESWSARFDQPRKCEELAQVAVAVAGRLSADTYGDRVVEDLRARCRAFLGNAHRIMSDFRGAEDAFGQAEKHFARGSGGPTERARLLGFRASLSIALGNFDEAAELLDRVIEMSESSGDREQLGQALISRGTVYGLLDDLEGAVELLQAGIGLVDLEEEPRLVLAGVHNLMWSLNLAGRSREALTLLMQWRFLYLEVGDHTTLLRLEWLEGLIAMELGRLDQAEGSLREVRRGFIDQGIGYDAAVVSLDLALLYLRQGRMADVNRLAKEMLPIFRSRDVHREAAVALIMFYRAAEQEQLTIGLIKEIAHFLQKARHNPTLRFQGAA